MKKIIRSLIVLILVIGIGYIAVNNYIKSSLEPVDSNSDTFIEIEIPSGSTTGMIAKVLSENNLIKNESVFKYYVKKTHSDSKLKAGVFTLSQSMNVEEIVNNLVNKSQSGSTINLTIIEGLTLEDCAKSISSQLGLNYDRLLELMNNADYFRNDFEFLKDNENIKNLQGFLMPETYNVYKTSTEEDVLYKMLSLFDEYYKTSIKPGIEKGNLNLEETITLASIVEKEAVLSDEQSIIAKVFLNRLDIGMKLQSCATVNYILGEWKDVLTYDDIAVDSEYNTYINAGLPPTPINSPGKGAIDAVLHPADVDYLYFVAKGDGSHAFSNNYDDHLAAKNKYLGN